MLKLNSIKKSILQLLESIYNPKNIFYYFITLSIILILIAIVIYLIYLLYIKYKYTYLESFYANTPLALSDIANYALTNFPLVYNAPTPIPTQNTSSIVASQFIQLQDATTQTTPTTINLTTNINISYNTNAIGIINIMPSFNMNSFNNNSNSQIILTLGCNNSTPFNICLNLNTDLSGNISYYISYYIGTATATTNIVKSSNIKGQPLYLYTVLDFINNALYLYMLEQNENTNQTAAAIPLLIILIPFDSSTTGLNLNQLINTQNSTINFGLTCINSIGSNILNGISQIDFYDYTNNIFLYPQFTNTTNTATTQLQIYTQNPLTSIQTTNYTALGNIIDNILSSFQCVYNIEQLPILQSDQGYQISYFGSISSDNTNPNPIFSMSNGPVNASFIFINPSMKYNPGNIEIGFADVNTLQAKTSITSIGVNFDSTKIGVNNIYINGNIVAQNNNISIVYKKSSIPTQINILGFIISLSYIQSTDTLTLQIFYIDVQNSLNSQNPLNLYLTAQFIGINTNNIININQSTQLCSYIKFNYLPTSIQNTTNIISNNSTDVSINTSDQITGYYLQLIQYFNFYQNTNTIIRTILQQLDTLINTENITFTDVNNASVLPYNNITSLIQPSNNTNTGTGTNTGAGINIGTGKNIGLGTNTNNNYIYSYFKPSIVVNENC